MKTVYIKIIILAAFISLACTTRVSEWVLLNSLPNQYTLVFFHSNPPDEALKKQNLIINDRIKTANIKYKEVNRKDIKEPYYGLYYENRLFSKFKTTDEFRDITTSPLREKIAAELMAGKLCVMLYLKTDNNEKDEKGLKTLRKTVSDSPFGHIIPVFELSRNSKDEDGFATLLLNVEDDLKGIQEPMLFGIFGRFKALEPLLGKGM